MLGEFNSVASTDTAICSTRSSPSNQTRVRTIEKNEVGSDEKSPLQDIFGLEKTGSDLADTRRSRKTLDEGLQKNYGRLVALL